jgi:membrane-bound ClpP family serine protease
MIDWQTAAVALIIAAALFYVARRGLARLRSFRASTSCATGCGKCGETEKPTNPAGSVLVNIKRTRD